MANEIRATYDTGETLYALIFNAAGEVWNVVGPSANTFAAYIAGNVSFYAIVMPEIATASTQYRGTFDADIVAGVYSVSVYLQAGGPPVVADDDRIGETATMYWDGAAEIDHSTMEALLDTIEGYTDKIDDATDGLTAIKAEVEGIGGVAMRGTDGVSLVIPDATGVVSAYLLSDVIGVDGDTLETLSGQLDVLGAGSGGTAETYTVTDDVTGFGIDGVHVWVTTDAAGVNIIWAGFTNAAGVVNYYHDLATGTTVYLWRELAGYRFDNPDSESTS